MCIWSLKGTFSALRREMDINLDDLSTVIYSCFVLNNYCEINKESISDEQVRTTMNSERESQSRNQRTTQGSMSHNPGINGQPSDQ